MELLGATEAERLYDIVPNSTIKHSNERVYYSIDAITTAITDKKKVSFLYFDYAVNGKREYRKDKERYIVNPLGLAYSDDKLYLICFHDKYGNPINYRVDRMDEVQVEREDITHLKEFENFNLNAYRQEQFDMYRGEQANVELIFPKDLLEIAIDRFGEGIEPISKGNDEYIVRVAVQVAKHSSHG